MRSMYSYQETGVDENAQEVVYPCKFYRRPNIGWRLIVFVCNVKRG